MPKWFDDGVRVNLSVSTSGDFVSLGTRTEYPFVAGSGGLPANWTFESLNGGLTSDVNLTTADGRFSVSNISTTVSNQNKYYSIVRDFPVVNGKRYNFLAQVRTMDNKTATKYVFSYQYNGLGSQYTLTRSTQADWEQIAETFVPSPGNTFIRIRLSIYYYHPPFGTPATDWGAQWQGPALVEMSSTYPDPTWKAITCDVQSLTIAYGRSRYTGRFDVATASIGVKNVDGEFTYQTVHPWGLRPGRFVKVTITDPKGTSYPAYYGLIDSITDSFPIDGKVNAVLNCIDTSSLLSTSNVPTTSGENVTSLSGNRFRNLLDAVSWHPSMMAYDAGVYYQQGVYANGRSVRDELGLTADSEGALFWADRNGLLTFRDRNYIDLNPLANTVQAELMAECPTYIDEVRFRFPGIAGNGMSMPYQSTMAFTQFVTVECYVAFDDASSSARQTLVAQNGRWEFRKDSGKRLGFTNWVGSAQSTIDAPLGTGQFIWVMVQYDVYNGLVTFYTKTTGNYVQLGTTVSITGTMPTNTNGLTFGGIGPSLSTPLKGIMNSVIVGYGTGYVVTFAASSFPGQVGATVLNLSTGQQITVTQTGTNVIVQADPTITPHRLIPIDSVPTAQYAAVQHLKALETDWTRDRVVNDVQIANQGGAAFQKIDNASQQKYGPRTYQRLDFLNDNAHPEYNLQRIDDFMVGFTDSILRVNRVTFVPDTDTYAWALSMFLMDLVRIRYQHPIEGWGYAVATHIQGYVHSLTMNGWETSINLDQPESFVYWDTPPNTTVGWDIDYWDVGIWDNADPNAAYWTSGQVWTDTQTRWSE